MYVFTACRMKIIRVFKQICTRALSRCRFFVVWILSVAGLKSFVKKTLYRIVVTNGVSEYSFSNRQITELKKSVGEIASRSDSLIFGPWMSEVGF
jgi:hypothetical protein